MNLCLNCGKELTVPQKKYCEMCHQTIKKEAEIFFSKAKNKEIKKRAWAYPVLVIILALFGLSISLGFVHANNDAQDQKGLANAMTVELQKTNNELNALKTTLSQTEEGRKQLEAAKAQVEDQNKQLGARATSAEQTAAQAKSDLAKTQASLSAKQADLSKISGELAAKQAQLDKANRGVALFNKTNTLFDQFADSCVTITDYIISAYEALDSGDYAAVDNYINLLEGEIARNDNLYDQIQAIFNQIRSGNY